MKKYAVFAGLSRIGPNRMVYLTANEVARHFGLRKDECELIDVGTLVPSKNPFPELLKIRPPLDYPGIDRKGKI